jgi:hypothetical protein
VFCVYYDSWTLALNVGSTRKLSYYLGLNTASPEEILLLFLKREKKQLFHVASLVAKDPDPLCLEEFVIEQYSLSALL